MSTFDFEKLGCKSFVNNKRGLRAEFYMVFGMIFLRVTDIATGIELSDECASGSEIKFLLAKNSL